MPENVNWSAVWQSVTDTWLPFCLGFSYILSLALTI